MLCKKCCIAAQIFCIKFTLLLIKSITFFNTFYRAFESFSSENILNKICRFFVILKYALKCKTQCYLYIFIVTLKYGNAIE